MSTRVVVVSGGAGGIGAAVAAGLAADGWSVVVADRRGSDAAAVAGGLEAPAVGVELDVRDPTSWEAAVAVAAELGPVAGLVNGAGILGAGGVLEVDLDVFDDVLAVNLKGCLLGLRALVPAMEAAGGGSVVNIGSAVAFSGTPALVAYGASKWALRGLTRTAAIELGPRGIRVNAVLPGTVATPLSGTAGLDRSAWFAALPGGRQGCPGDVAEAVRYLMSDASRHSTAAELTVDGGMSARGALPPR
ncbi:glucose 1-dehydrogenase [Intrasporangium mesophilum]